MSCEKDKIICYDENKKLIQQILIDNKEKIIGYIRVSYSDDSEKEIKRQEDIIINYGNTRFYQKFKYKYYKYK